MVSMSEQWKFDVLFIKCLIIYNIHYQEIFSIIEFSKHIWPSGQQIVFLNKTVAEILPKAWICILCVSNPAISAIKQTCKIISIFRPVFVLTNINHPKQSLSNLIGSLSPGKKGRQNCLETLNRIFVIPTTYSMYISQPSGTGCFSPVDSSPL